MRELEGGCQCGKVRYRIVGEPVMAAICHCTMCRRANAAPAVAWAMFHDAEVAFLEGPPAAFRIIHVAFHCRLWRRSINAFGRRRFF
jgi:hypothetical protein